MKRLRVTKFLEHRKVQQLILGLIHVMRLFIVPGRLRLYRGHPNLILHLIGMVFSKNLVIILAVLRRQRLMKGQSTMIRRYFVVVTVIFLSVINSFLMITRATKLWITNFFQLNVEEMQIMASDTSPLRVLDFNLVETNINDALSSKSNAISLSIIVVYQLIYAFPFFRRILA